MELSGNVKKYFVHVLKGIGIGYPNAINKEMSEADIEVWLDQGVTPGTLYGVIASAVLHQIDVDRFTDRFAFRQTEFDAKTFSTMMGKKVGDKNFFDHIASDLTFGNLAREKDERGSYYHSNYLVPEMVIDVLMHGVRDQKLSPKEKEDINKQWSLIRNFIYDQKQENRLKHGLPRERYDEYTKKRLETDVFQTVLKFCNGNEKLAKSILTTKVDQEMLLALRANKDLKEFSDDFCRELDDSKRRDPEKDGLIVQDVLLAMTHRSIGSHVIAFFKTRSNEQQINIEKNPHTTEFNKQNKIGNLVGKSGQKDIKNKTKNDMVVAMDGSYGLPDGKKGPWRGYKKLFDSIVNFLAEIYDPIPSIGFTQKIMKRHGTWIDTEIKESVEDRGMEWRVEFQSVPQKYIDEKDPNKLNEAGEFYRTTKARILADKVLLIAKQSENYSTDDAVKNEQMCQMDYLQKRIDTANGILNNKIPSRDNPDFKNNNYYKKLSCEILENKNKDRLVSKFLGATNQYKDANEYLTLAYSQFSKAYKNAKTSEQKGAVREMAVEIFHLHDHVNKGLISDQEIDALTERFWQSGLVPCLNDESTANKKINKKQENSFALTNIDYENISHDSKYDAIKLFMKRDISKVKSFVEIDLLNNSEALKSETQTHKQFEDSMIDDNRSEILSSMAKKSTGPEMGK